MFDCNYCGTQHALEERSVEHVVPEALGNRTLKLPNVCAFVNNFFASSFETPVLKTRFVRMVRLEFGLDRVPKNGAYFIEEFDSVGGRTERLYRVDGRERLRDKPTREVAWSVPFPAFDAAGNQHSIDVPLPPDCGILMKSSGGDDIECADARAKAEKTLARALEYMKRLASDPDINPEVSATLRAKGWHLRAPTKVLYNFEVEQVGEPRWVGDLLPKDYEYDRELWARFYLKLGWCLACRELGRSALIALGGEPVLKYLTLAVDPKFVRLAVSAVPDLAARLFRDAKIGGEQIWFWKATLPEAAALGAELLPGLEPALQERRRGVEFFVPWVQTHQPGQLRLTPGGAPNEQRVHKLRLARSEFDGRAALTCGIDLFGGVMSATAQLTVPMPAASFPDLREVVVEIPVVASALD